MRLLVDLMGAQTHGSRNRGIGRYTRELALALARDRRDGIDLHFTMSENFPDVAAELRALLSPHVPASAFSSYVTPATSKTSAPQSDPARRIGEAIVRRHVAGIAPDCLLATSLYEVAPDDFSYFNLRRQPASLASCILYDLIPRRMPKQYLRYADYRRVYEEQTAVVASADILFAISDCTKRDAIELLNIEPDRIVTIGGAADAVFAPRVRAPDEIAAIRHRLGLREKFILCAAGVDPRKNATAALDAFLSLSADDRRGAQFVLLAPLSEDERAKLLARRGIAADDVKLIARVDDDDLAFLYAQAELFLFPSLYEGFGLPVLEAMQCSAAIIAGNNSSIPEIANRPDVLCDMSSPAAIARALAKGLCDADWRADVRAWGLVRSREFSWARTAQSLQDGLLAHAPALTKTRPRREPPACFALHETLETEIADILRDTKEAALTPAKLAPLILQSAPQLYSERARRLLIDVTAIAGSDRRTGIQRVVRNVVRSLYAGGDRTMTPVAVRLDNGRLRTCQDFVSALLGCPRTVPDADIEVTAGECLLMLDNSWDTFARFRPIFADVRAAGGTIVTCVYDLIPKLHLAASVEPVPAVFAAWLRAALLQSDGIITISQAVMHDLLAFIDDRHPPCRPDLRVGWFQCGSDIEADTGSISGAVRPAMSNVFATSDPVFMMVSTVEPRKGHWVALDAFDALRAQGVAARLLIVGSKGWHVDALIERMRTHPGFGEELFWFDDASDAELAFAYARCTALLNPSYAEGFGLPLVEAARANKPVICSDIPVFREIARDGALYFRVNDSEAMAQAMRALLEGTRAADPGRVLRTTWTQAAQRIVDVVMHDGWSQILRTSERSSERPASD